MKCLETNKVCSKYNKKCKECQLDEPKGAINMTDYEIMMKEKKAREEFEEAIPTECKKCTLLEKDYEHRTIKCIYRSKDKCILDRHYILRNLEEEE